MFPRTFAEVCLENCHTEYGKCVATVPLFSDTSNEEFSNVLCVKPVILVDLFLELKIVVIQDSEDGKRSIPKKIVNYHRMFTELREALAGGRALDEAKESTPRTNSFNNSRASPRGSILVRVTPIGEAAKQSTCENQAEGVQRRPSTKRALFSDQCYKLAQA